MNDRWGSGMACNHGGYFTCTDRYSPGKQVIACSKKYAKIIDRISGHCLHVYGNLVFYTYRHASEAQMGKCYDCGQVFMGLQTWSCYGWHTLNVCTDHSACCDCKVRFFSDPPNIYYRLHYPQSKLLMPPPGRLTFTVTYALQQLITTIFTYYY